MGPWGEGNVTAQALGPEGMATGPAAMREMPFVGSMPKEGVQLSRRRRTMWYLLTRTTQ